MLRSTNDKKLSFKRTCVVAAAAAVAAAPDTCVLGKT